MVIFFKAARKETYFLERTPEGQQLNLNSLMSHKLV